MNQSLRRAATANALLQIVQRHKPELVESLQDSFFDVFHQTGSLQQSRLRTVPTWCANLRLSCLEIENAASDLAFTGSVIETMRGDEHGEAFEYRIPYRPGESKRAFLKRAGAVFDAVKAHDERSGEVEASDEVKEKHVEWLFRFQVLNQGYKKIARADRQDYKHVKRTIADLAALLGLRLRRTTAGRPAGTKGRRQILTHR